MENQPEAIKVHCSFAAMVPVSELKFHPKNPNTHPPEQLELYIKILRYQGWRLPIRVSQLSGFVTKGNGALQAAQAAGWELVPVEYQNYDNEEQELADLVADNQLARIAEMNNSKLQELMIQLDTGAFDMTLTAYDQIKLEKLFTSFGVKRPDLELGGAEKVAPDASEPGKEPSGEQSEMGPDGTPVPSSAPTSHVRMVQLFLNDDTQSEFVTIVEFFQKVLNIDNATDAVMEVLRSAYRSYLESNPAPTDAQTDSSGAPTPEEPVAEVAVGEAH